MNSQEHKAEAEALLALIEQGTMYPERVLEKALVHATLATIPDQPNAIVTQDPWAGAPTSIQ